MSCHAIACHGTGTSQLLLPFMLMPYQKSFDGFIARKNPHVQPIWPNHVTSCHVMSKQGQDIIFCSGSGQILKKGVK